LCKLLEKERKLYFDDDCLRAFGELKKKLVTTPIIISPDWGQSFEVMCDRSEVALGAVLGQRCEKILHPIYYASKSLKVAQRKYTATEHELIIVVFPFEKFRSYLLGVKFIVHTDHSVLRYLTEKKDVKQRLIR